MNPDLDVQYCRCKTAPHFMSHFLWLSSRAGNELQIDKMVGRTMVVTGNTPMAQQGGFYCNVCDCIVKDSISWLDHVNGKKHNRALGMNMRSLSSRSFSSLPFAESSLFGRPTAIVCYRVLY